MLNVLFEHSLNASSVSEGNQRVALTWEVQGHLLDKENRKKKDLRYKKDHRIIEYP